MNPSAKRVSTRYRKASFDIGDYLSEALEKAMDRLLKNLERDLKAKIERSFEAKFPDWEIVRFAIRDLGPEPYESYSRLSIVAEAGMKPSHPEYEYFGEGSLGYDDTSKKMLSWMESIGYATDMSLSSNGDMGPDFQYYLDFGKYVW